jgi:putative SOS response-associated peptidase YedK
MLTPATHALLRQYHAALLEPLEWQPRYNIAPTQSAPAVVLDESGARLLRLLRWGLIPSWSKDDSFASKTINCRSETAHEKPSFRAAFQSRRCLVPISGFYEWKADASDSRQRKTPFLVQPLRAGAETTLAVAGLWESWKVRDGSGAQTGEILDTFTLLTTQANGFLKPLHDRMPRILDSREQAEWMSPDTPMDRLRALASTPYAGENLAMHPVSTRVNSPRNEGPELAAPAAAPAPKKPLRLLLLLLGSSTAVLSACAVTPTRPCSAGGDVSWRSSVAKDGNIVGDKHCLQKQGPDGRYRNHGEYKVTFPGGRKALEGRFENGKKEGFWSEYNERGEKIAERYYEAGVEKSPPSGARP